MIKALNAIILLAGIILAVAGALAHMLILSIIGNVLVVLGVLLYLILKRQAGPLSNPPKSNSVDV